MTGKHDARHDHEYEGDVDRNHHQAGRDEVLAHVAAVFAVENSERVDYAAFGQFDRQQADGDGRPYIDIGYPDRHEPQGHCYDHRRGVFHADGDRILQRFREVEFLHFHN